MILDLFLGLRETCPAEKGADVPIPSLQQCLYPHSAREGISDGDDGIGGRFGQKRLLTEG
jgi:hypothetical protein